MEDLSSKYRGVLINGFTITRDHPSHYLEFSLSKDFFCPTTNTHFYILLSLSADWNSDITYPTISITKNPVKEKGVLLPEKGTKLKIRLQIIDKVNKTDGCYDHSILPILANKISTEVIYSLSCLKKERIPSRVPTLGRWCEKLINLNSTREALYLPDNTIPEELINVTLTEQTWETLMMEEKISVQPGFKETHKEIYEIDKSACNQIVCSLMEPSLEFCFSTLPVHHDLQICSFHFEDMYYTGLQPIFSSRQQLKENIYEYIRNTHKQYIIDPDKPFNGIPEGLLDSGIVAGTKSDDQPNGLTLEAYKQKEMKPELTLLTQKEFFKKRHEFRQNEIQQTYRKITEEHFLERVNEFVCREGAHGDISYYFGYEVSPLRLQAFYFTYHGNYFYATEDLFIKEDLVKNKIKSFLLDNGIYYNHPWLVKELDMGTNKEFLFFEENESVSTPGNSLQIWSKYPFTVNGVHFPTLGHWLMYHKARILGHTNLANLIPEANLPADILVFEDKFKHLNVEIWEEQLFTYLVSGLYHKFSQHEEIKEYLLSTHEQVIVYAKPDSYGLGTGIARSHSNITLPHLWPGDNLVGFALMETRGHFVNEKKKYPYQNE